MHDFVGVYVAPQIQSRGIGSALLKKCTNIADQVGVFIWVHSSEAAWKAYEKHGFDVVGEFYIDLDA